ncbi:MAG: AsmA-like C-terminal region-containing protein [Paracoccaceae bacterium]
MILRRWIWLATVLLIASVLAAATWFMVPFLVSPDRIAGALQQAVAKHGLRLDYEHPPSMVMDPMPRIDLGPVTIVAGDGSLLLRSTSTQARPSPWMLVGGDTAVGNLTLEGATARLPATLATDGMNLTGATVTLNRSAGGALGGRFEGKSADDPISGTYGIGNLDALIGGSVSAATLTLSGNAMQTDFEGTLQLVPDEMLPNIVGRWQHRIEAPGRQIFGSDAPGIASELQPVVLTMRLNLAAKRMSVQLQAVSMLRDRPVNLDAHFTGETGWVQSGALNTELTARAGGLFSAQFSGQMNWRTPLAYPISGPGQLVMLEVAELLDWMGIEPPPAMQIPRVARLKGQVSADNTQIAFDQAELVFNDITQAWSGVLRYNNMRPQLALDTHFETVSLNDLGALSKGLDSLTRQPVELAARVSVGDLQIGRYMARSAELALEASPSIVSVTLTEASIPGGKASARLSLSPKDDTTDLTIEINGADMAKLTGGAVSGAGVGRVNLRWNGQNRENMNGEGALSVYAGALSDIDLGVTLAGMAANNSEARFAALSGDFQVKDGAVLVPAVTIAGAEWALEGVAEADISSGKLAARLTTSGINPAERRIVEISGTLDAPIATTSFDENIQSQTQPRPESPESDTSGAQATRSDTVAAFTPAPLPEQGAVATPLQTQQQGVSSTSTDIEDARALTAVPPIPLRAPR